MRKYEFDAAKTKDEIVEWIRNYFRKNGPDCNAVIGISGGKDSSIVAALCCEALGNGRVIGVLMPQGAQSDIDVARELVKHLGIKSFESLIWSYKPSWKTVPQSHPTHPPEYQCTPLPALCPDP